jgi:hypothetical protein
MFGVTNDFTIKTDMLFSVAFSNSICKINKT